MKKPIVVASLIVASFLTQAQASSLGKLHVYSRVGEPLDVRIEVVDIQAGMTPPVVKLGGIAWYYKIGKKRISQLLTSKVIQDKTNPNVVYIRGTEPINEPVFALVVEKIENGVTIAKQYSVKLGPKAVATAKADTTPAQTVKSVAKTTSSPSAKSAPATTSLTLPQGSGLWSFCVSIKSAYPKATMDQLMVAVVRKNPNAFSYGRVGSAKNGATLDLPTWREVDAVPVEEALALVRLSKEADVTNRASAALLKKAQDIIDQTRNLKRVQTEQKTRLAKGALLVDRVPTIAQSAKEPVESAPKVEAKVSKAEVKAPKTEVKTPAKTEKPVISKSLVAEASNKTVTVTAIEDTTPVTKVEEKKPVVSEPVKEVKPVVQPKKSSLSNTLIAAILGMLVVIGGAIAFILYRNGRRKGLMMEVPITFDVGNTTTDAQFKGVSDLINRRMASDAAAKEGFQLKGEPMPQAVAAIKSDFASENVEGRVVTEPTLRAPVDSDEEKEVPKLTDLGVNPVEAHTDPLVGETKISEPLPQPVSEKPEEVKTEVKEDVSSPEATATESDVKVEPQVVPVTAASDFAEQPKVEPVKEPKADEGLSPFLQKEVPSILSMVPKEERTVTEEEKPVVPQEVSSEARVEPVLGTVTNNETAISSTPEIETCEQRLNRARHYIRFGATDSAREVLETVLRDGTAEEQDAARELLAKCPA